VFARLCTHDRCVAALSILAIAMLLSAFINDTPMGYQTNVLIMQPGGYVFRDFVRVGGPLVLLMIVAFSIALARAYPA
jgi:di/tricarboxylate transporter